MVVLHRGVDTWREGHVITLVHPTTQEQSRVSDLYLGKDCKESAMNVKYQDRHAENKLLQLIWSGYVDSGLGGQLQINKSLKWFFVGQEFCFLSTKSERDERDSLLSIWIPLKVPPSSILSSHTWVGWVKQFTSEDYVPLESYWTPSVTLGGTTHSLEINEFTVFIPNLLF